MTRSRLLGTLIAFLCLLLMWWLLRPSSAAPIARSSPSVDLAAIEAETEPPSEMLREAVLSSQFGQDAAVRFQVLKNGERVPVTGMLRTDSVEQGPATYEVEDGAGVIPSALASYLLRHARQPVIPASVTWQDGIAAISAVEFSAPDKVLNLTIAPTIELRLRVMDLAGNPISGARIIPILDFAILEPRSEYLTDSDGNAAFRLSERHGRIQFRVGKEGYAPHQQCADAASQVIELEIRLRRILGYVIAINRQWRATMTCNFGTGVRTGLGFAIPTLIRNSLLDRLTGAGLFDPVEEEVYLQLFTETEWVTESLGRAGLVVDGQIVAAMEVPVLPLSDPAFTVHRFPDDQTQQLPRHPWVQFRLIPDEAFLAEPPEELRIRLGVLEGQPDEPGDPAFTYAELRLVAGKRYRAALPIGRYEFLAEGRDWEMSSDSLGDGEDPGFAPGQTFQVPPGATSEDVLVRLAPGEQWIEYTICDTYGRQLDIRALLFPHREAPHPAESHFGIQLGVWPHGRFIRPGVYDLLAAVRSQDRVRRISSVLTWPPPGLPHGNFPVVLPEQDSDFDPFSFQ